MHFFGGGANSKRESGGGLLSRKRTRTRRNGLEGGGKERVRRRNGGVCGKILLGHRPDLGGGIDCMAVVARERKGRGRLAKRGAHRRRIKRGGVMGAAVGLRASASSKVGNREGENQCDGFPCEGGIGKKKRKATC